MQLQSLVIAKYAGRLLAIVPTLIYAYEYGPLPGCPGPPSDRTCSTPACHTGSCLTYEPGVKQHLVVTITDVQATERPAASPRSGEAGDFESTDSYAQVVCQDDSQKPAGQPCGETPSFQLASTSPTITTGGAVNGASFGSTISAGSWVSIMGSALAIDTRSWNSSDFVNGVAPLQLDGTRVTINGNPAFVAYISPTQVNVLAPDDTAIGPIQVQVSVQGQASSQATAQMAAFSPALFLWQSKYAVAQHADYSAVGPPGLFPDVTTTPALPGETVVLYGTGFGPTSPPVPAGVLISKAVPLANPVIAQIGGIDAPVTYAGLAQGYAGLDQINVTIPDTAPDGDLPIVLNVGGVLLPAALVTVQRGP
jgi:uncharacterized protein (TIGR03437 family)